MLATRVQCWHCGADAIYQEGREGYADYTRCLICARLLQPPVRVEPAEPEPAEPEPAEPLPSLVWRGQLAYLRVPGKKQWERIAIEVEYEVVLTNNGTSVARFISATPWLWGFANPIKVTQLAADFLLSTGLRLTGHALVLLRDRKIGGDNHV